MLELDENGKPISMINLPGQSYEPLVCINCEAKVLAARNKKFIIQVVLLALVCLICIIGISVTIYFVR